MICGFKQIVYFNLPGPGEYSFWGYISEFYRNMCIHVF